jgi:hypothetical protein
MVLLAAPSVASFTFVLFGTSIHCLLCFCLVAAGTTVSAHLGTIHLSLIGTFYHIALCLVSSPSLPRAKDVTIGKHLARKSNFFVL